MNQTEVVSIFSGNHRPIVVDEPFPHAILNEPIDDSVCLNLIEQFPQLPSPAKDGAKVHLPVRKLLQREDVSNEWKSFVQMQYETAHLLVALFADRISKQHPDLTDRFGSPEQWPIGRRGIDPADQFVLLCDVQPSLHAPIPGMVPVQERKAHLKIRNKLIICQYLMRHPNDERSGGDLQFYSPREGRKLIFGPEQQVMNTNILSLQKTIPYRRNVAVAWLNSARALQTMSPRSETTYPLQYLNIILELQEPFFDLP